jgi:dihydroneopterin aldolase
MIGIITVKGIKQYCYHGCLPEEEKIGGWYETDVEVEADMAGAVKTDELSKTADYTEINQIVRNEMNIRSKLVEHVAGRIATVLLKQIPRIHSVAVTVSKLRPPIEGEAERFSVSIKMKRTD